MLRAAYWQSRLSGVPRNIAIIISIPIVAVILITVLVVLSLISGCATSKFLIECANRGVGCQ